MVRPGWSLQPDGAAIDEVFGGENKAGSGCKSGTAAWKAYMRRQTSAVNFSGTLELAQNIRLEL